MKWNKLFKKQEPYIIALLLSILVVVSCSESSNDILEIPENYNGSTFESDASTELLILSQLSKLVAAMQKGRSSANQVHFDTLANYYKTGNPSLSAITTDYYDAKIQGETGWIAQLANASAKLYQPTIPNGDGGVFGGYLFNGYGLEMEQLIEKGLFSAALYQQFIVLTQTEISPQSVNKMLALFGANPTFPSSNNATLHPFPDRYVAVYTARRDKNDGFGFYSNIKKAFIQLQAAVRSGSTFSEERNEAIQILKQNWEKAIMSTVINYCYTTINYLSETAPTNVQKASALHAYSEAVGFVHGWKGISASDKIITDSQIDEILTLLHAPHDAVPSSYLFVTESVTELPKLLEVIQKLKVVYSFSDAELEDFKKNWVSEQTR